MATLNFIYRKESLDYPENSIQMRFGKSFTFSSKPIGSIQRMLTLTFPVMFWYTLNDGSIVSTDEQMATHQAEQGFSDTEKALRRNLSLGHLMKFYEDHQLWQTFDYNSQLIGAIKARFSAPLRIPTAEENGHGAVRNIEVKLIQVYE